MNRTKELLEDSTSYQMILEKGRKQSELRTQLKSVLEIATQRFGEPSVEVRKTVEAISDFSRLERMFAQLLRVSSWSDVLATV
jgi:hypothetical protein